MKIEDSHQVWVSEKNHQQNRSTLSTFFLNVLLKTRFFLHHFCRTMAGACLRTPDTGHRVVSGGQCEWTMPSAAWRMSLDQRSSMWGFPWIFCCIETFWHFLSPLFSWFDYSPFFGGMMQILSDFSAFCGEKSDRHEWRE